MFFFQLLFSTLIRWGRGIEKLLLGSALLVHKVQLEFSFFFNKPSDIGWFFRYIKNTQSVALYTRDRHLVSPPSGRQYDPMRSVDS